MSFCKTLTLVTIWEENKQMENLSFPLSVTLKMNKLNKIMHEFTEPNPYQTTIMYNEHLSPEYTVVS